MIIISVITKKKKKEERIKDKSIKSVLKCSFWSRQMKDVGKLALMEKRADILDDLCVFATEGEQEKIAKRMVCCAFMRSSLMKL